MIMIPIMINIPSETYITWFTLSLFVNKASKDHFPFSS